MTWPDIVGHLSQRDIDTFRPLSESWHRSLGLQSQKIAVVPSMTYKRKGGELRTSMAKAKKLDISWAGAEARRAHDTSYIYLLGLTFTR